ncbi:Crp/Fnr family transcriptional regulator (plasmid) [Enterocloster clostridioformis]
MDVHELIKNAPKQVIPYFDIRTYPKGSSILQPDEHNSSLFLLLEGTAEVYIYTLNGMFISLYRYGKNGCFGEVELFCESRTTLGIAAIDNCKVVRISRKGVETWVKEDHNFCEFLLRQMASKIAENSDNYIRSASMDLKSRILHCLYRHKRLGTLDTLTKEQLMNEVCAPIRSLNRILAQCREDGLVIYEKHRFCIIDEKRFADAISEQGISHIL